MAKLTTEEKALRASQRKAQRVLDKQAKWEAAVGPEIAAFWRNSATASVMNSYATGNFKVLVAR